MTITFSQVHQRADDCPQKSLETSVVTCNMFSNLYAHVGRTFKLHILCRNTPVITQLINREGQPFWRVDNPKTGEQFYFDSRSEVFVWLDNGQFNGQSHSQKPTLY